MIKKEQQSNSRKIIVIFAFSNEDEIVFNLSDAASPYIRGKWNETHNSISMELKYPDTENTGDSIKASKNIKESLLRILTFLTCFILIITLFMLFYSTCYTISNNLLFSCIIGTFFSCLIYLVYIFYLFYLVYTPLINLSVKNNHSAEHMIVNFIEKYQKLPITMQELQKSSRFNSNCGGIKDFISFIKFFHGFFPMLLVLVINPCVFLLKLNIIPLQLRLVILLFIAVIIFIFIRKRLYLPFRKRLNFIIQLFNTTSNVSEDSLILAYFVARAWILNQYPEYANEDWMQHSEFLDNFPIKEIQ